MIPMKQTPLSQLAFVSAGQGAPKDNEFSESGVPFVRAGSLEALLSGKNESELELVSTETAKLRNLKIYPKGTILFAKSGMSATKDRVYVLQNPAHVVSHLATLIPKDGAHVDYLRLALKRFSPSSLIKDPAYPAIGLGEIENFEIPVPEEFEDQIRIAHLLGKVEGLIGQRKQHLQQLDDLLKSVFLEMFGNIRKQESPHPFVALRPYLKANSGKSCKGVEAADKTDIPIFGGNGVKGWATKSLYEEPVVIAGRVGQQCGVIHTSEGPCWVTDNAIVLNIQNSSLLNIQYLATAFQHAPIRQKVQQLDLPFINQAMLLDYPLPLPPIELQNQFSAILKKVSAIRQRYEHGFAELQDLYGTLSQKAFNGELDLSRVPLPADKTKPADPLPLPEDIVTPTEVLNRVVQFAPPESRSELLARWFNRYLANSAPDASLDSPGLLESAWQTLQETRLESDGDSPALTLADYDALKDLIFAALEGGTLVQTFAKESNRVSLQRRSADWGSF